ncbi:Reverse transcriptase domain-containing protein [Aphis craccivora]|uniref:Reverse transcriptase domain-containing protein n=1 Tax=Aphis craccivora TaxID=307492 RepID=A0A6G0YAY3_APHCR|nr:Reverse transcriptase domain-containing protein [Aphis craccivora]
MHRHHLLKGRDRFRLADARALRPAPAATSDSSNVHPGRSIKKRDPLAFTNHVETHPWKVTRGDTTEHAVDSARSLDQYLIEACDASMPRRRTGPGNKLPVHWWTVEIADLRRNVLSCRRNYQRSFFRLGNHGSCVARTRFLTARKELRLAIKTV